MRIWSLHPSFLDSKGLVALWREALLAKHVLEGKTKGYKNHPQLLRFKETKNPVMAINAYLSGVFKEAEFRSFCFDKTKINWNFEAVIINVTNAQLEYEKEHLLRKLKVRDKEHFKKIVGQKVFPHPIFRIVGGSIEMWEKTKGNAII